jgi:uncharacterized protein YigE (DUF2233 family)
LQASFEPKRPIYLEELRMRYFTIAILLALALSRCSAHTNYEDAFISYEADVKSQALKMYWRDENDQPFKSIGRLNAWLQLRGEQLQFAMNGGMYNADHVPVGLFVQAQKTLTPLDTTTGAGNFYLNLTGFSTPPPMAGPWFVKQRPLPTIRTLHSPPNPAPCCL